MRTEMANRSIASGANALASSIILACRARRADAPVATQKDFLDALKSELPGEIRWLEAKDIAPVDVEQATIGPGMATFSRFARVLKPDGTDLSVRSALAFINQTLQEVRSEREGEVDSLTQFCLVWYREHGFEEGDSGQAELLATAKDTAVRYLNHAGVTQTGAGKTRLKRRDELDEDWDPSTDPIITDWECAQQLVRTLHAEHGGDEAAAALVRSMGTGKAQNAHDLAHNLFDIAEKHGWTDDAEAYNSLIQSWADIQRKVGPGTQATLV
jgi:putative DNA methylase